MPYARNRPPTAPSGRPSKGPRPVTSASTKLLSNLRAASTHLRATDADELANTVDDLLTPNGWRNLRTAVEADAMGRQLTEMADLKKRLAQFGTQKGYSPFSGGDSFSISIGKVAHDRYKRKWARATAPPRLMSSTP